MPIVVGVRFKDSGKIYSFDPCELQLNVGDYVIVETVRGLELARIAQAQREVSDEEVVGELKTIIRRAEAGDFERMRVLQTRHAEVLARCAEKVREHDLPMNLVKAEYSFDGSRLTFYFTAEKRVDFRMLVRDLARTFKSRIELRQIGPRDEAKLLGGIGPCGRVLCCASFLPDYARVSIKMAKDQDLPLNPTKISGVCGRLLCCLSYEHEQYITMRTDLPRKGTWVQTPDGPGEVISQHVLKQQLVVQLASSGMQETYDLDQIEITTSQGAATTIHARSLEGITPPLRAPRPNERSERGERRKLRDEIDYYDLDPELELLEDRDDFAPPSPPPPQERRTPRQSRQRQPSSTLPEAPPRLERGPKGRHNPSEPTQPPAQPPSPPSQPRRRRRRSNRGSETE